MYWRWLDRDFFVCRGDAVVDCAVRCGAVPCLLPLPLGAGQVSHRFLLQVWEASIRI